MSMEAVKNQMLTLSHKPSPMINRGVYAALAYMASAVLLVLFNKAALSSYSFPSANVITFLQLVCSCLILYVMKYWKIISFTEGEPQSSSDNPATLVSFMTLAQTLPLALTYLLYMLVTMESVRGINVPMYTTLRRITVAFTMIVEYFLTGQKHSHFVISSVGIIIAGAFIAGARDLAFDAYSYSVVFIANICTAVYLSSISRIGKSSGLNTFGLMWCNGLICAPILLIWSSIRGDLQTTLNFPYLFDRGFQAVMLLSCMLAFLINYFVFLNTTLNSALTQTICGNLKVSNIFPYFIQQVDNFFKVQTIWAVIVSSAGALYRASYVLTQFWACHDYLSRLLVHLVAPDIDVQTISLGHVASILLFGWHEHSCTNELWLGDTKFDFKMEGFKFEFKSKLN